MSTYSPKSITAEPKKLFESGNIFSYQASVLDDNRVVLYKKGKQLGDGFYIVEISSNSGGIAITAFDVEKSQSLLMSIGSQKANECLERFEYNFEHLASCLRV